MGMQTPRPACVAEVLLATGHILGAARIESGAVRPGDQACDPVLRLGTQGRIVRELGSLGALGCTVGMPLRGDAVDAVKEAEIGDHNFQQGTAAPVWRLGVTDAAAA